MVLLFSNLSSTVQGSIATRGPTLAIFCWFEISFRPCQGEGIPQDVLVGGWDHQGLFRVHLPQMTLCSTIIHALHMQNAFHLIPRSPKSYPIQSSLPQAQNVNIQVRLNLQEAPWMLGLLVCHSLNKRHIVT